MAKPRKPADDMGINPGDLVNEIASEMKKAFKDDSVTTFDKYKQDVPRIWYPTGSLMADIALGGGLAGGRVSEWFGLNGSGKSTMSYAAIAATQERFPDKFCALVDFETSAYDSKAHMQKLGVDMTRLLYFTKPKDKPWYAEDAFERVEWLLRQPRFAGRLALIVIDSLGALVSRFEGEAKDKWDKNARVGGITAALSMFFRNISDNGLLYESNAHLMCLNQVRDNIGDQWNPFRTPGGRKVGHVAAQRVEVSRTRGQDFKNPEFDSKSPDPRVAEYIGQKIKMRVVKNKVGGQDGAQAWMNFYYDTGLDTHGEIIALAKHIGILVGTAWMTFIDPETGEEIAKYQGEKQWRRALAESDELWERLYTMVCKYIYAADGEDMEDVEDGTSE